MAGTVRVGHKVAHVDVSDGMAVFAEMQSRAGSDPANVRLAEGRGVYVAEEQSKDDEVRHTDEDVAYLGLAVGVYDSSDDGPSVPPVSPPVSPPADPGTPDGGTTAMEAGQVALDRKAGEDGWVRIAFEEEIVDAAVVIGPVTNADDSPVTAQVRHVDSRGFEVRLNEWGYQDDVHGLETVSWVAGSIGTHTMSDGAEVTFGAGTIGTQARSYGLGGTGDRIVFASVVGNGDDAVAYRAMGTTDEGFRACLMYEEGFAGDRDAGDYSLSWMSISADAPGVGQARIGHRKTAIDGADGDVLLASMQLQKGSDTATIRSDAASAEGVSLFVHEEASLDAEMRHTDEKVAWVTLEQGWHALVDGEPPAGGHGHAEHDHPHRGGHSHQDGRDTHDEGHSHASDACLARFQASWAPARAVASFGAADQAAIASVIWAVAALNSA